MKAWQTYSNLSTTFSVLPQVIANICLGNDVGHRPVKDKGLSTDLDPPAQGAILVRGQLKDTRRIPELSYPNESSTPWAARDENNISDSPGLTIMFTDLL